MPDLSIHLWPGWQIDHEIGSGSYGNVYEIHRQNGNYLEKAALKVIRIPKDRSELEQLRMDGLGLDNTENYFESQVQEIRNEIGVMQRFVGHSNIVSYEDYRIDRHEDEIGWDILIRMELLTSLPDYMRLHPLSENDVIRLGMEISSALSICHESGIIHRDIKPQNIFINKWGSFKLGDFGISRAMPGSGSVLSFKGTIPYMAPETYAMKDTDARSDLYSLALVMYRILNGGREAFLTAEVFTPDEKEAAMRKRLLGAPVPAPVMCSDGLWRVLSIALEADPETRYQNASQFHDALQRLESYEGTRQIIWKDKEDTRNIFHEDQALVKYCDNRREEGVGLFSAARERSSPPVSIPEVGDEKDRKDSTAKKKEIRLVIIGILIASAIFLIFFGIWNLNSSVKKKVQQKSEDEDSGEISLYQDLEEEQKEEETFIENGEEDTSESEEDGRDDDTEIEFEEGDKILLFEDPALEKAVLSCLNINDGYITKREAQSVTELNLSGAEKVEGERIKDLSGLAEFTNLETLYLDGNRITDISEVAFLTNLRKLHLESNNISDISPIENLSELQRLDLYQNSVSDISALSACEKMEMLDIRENIIRDISAVQGMTSLLELYLSDNWIEDLSPVKELTKLWYLSFNNNPVSDLSPVSDLLLLTTLCLSNTDVKDIRIVSKLPNLKYLDIRECQIDDVSKKIVKELKTKEGMEVKY